MHSSWPESVCVSEGQHDDVRLATRADRATSRTPPRKSTSCCYRYGSWHRRGKNVGRADGPLHRLVPPGGMASACGESRLTGGRRRHSAVQQLEHHEYYARSFKSYGECIWKVHGDYRLWTPTRCTSRLSRCILVALHTDTTPPQAIACSETDPDALSDWSIETLVKYMREMGEISISGQGFAYWPTQCRHWSFRAREAYRGPWTIHEGMPKPK